MRYRLLALLVVLTVALGTMVIASGILTEQAPPHMATEPVDLRAAETPMSRSQPRPPLLEGDTDGNANRTPQDGADSPEREAPPLHEGEVPESLALTGVTPAGGATGEVVPRDLGREFLVAPGTTAAPAGKTTITVRVEVEAGLPVTAGEFATFVMATLNDERSWAKDGKVTFARTDEEAPVRILLASPATVDTECAPLQTNGRWSCGRNGKAVLNADRWVNGASAFAEAGGNITTYRRYLINHEVGHLLGHEHVPCPGVGRLAPVMVQQSLRLDGCVPNGWVHP